MQDYYLSWPEVRRITGNKSRVTVWRWEQAGIFPKRRHVGPNSCGWLFSEIQKWMEQGSGGSNASAA